MERGAHLWAVAVDVWLLQAIKDRWADTGGSNAG